MNIQFLIKNFGNDVGCLTVEELKTTLTTKYKGCSVSILDKRKEISPIYFVSVTKDLEVIECYNNNKAFDFAKLEKGL